MYEIKRKFEKTFNERRKDYQTDFEISRIKSKNKICKM